MASDTHGIADLAQHAEPIRFAIQGRHGVSEQLDRASVNIHPVYTRGQRASTGLTG